MTKAAFFSPIDDLYGANKMLVMSVGSVGEIVDAIDIYVPEDYGYLRRLLEQEGLCSTNLEEAMLPIVHSKMFSLRGLFKLVKQFIGALKKLNTWRSYDIVYINTLALVPMLVVIAFARPKSHRSCTRVCWSRNKRQDSGTTFHTAFKQTDSGVSARRDAICNTFAVALRRMRH